MTPEEIKHRLASAGIPITILGYVDEAGVAKALGVHARTLQRYRERGVGPQATPIGTRWFYSIDAIAEFLNSANNDNVRQSTTNEHRQ